MARVLIGWELGAGRGHVERLSSVARRLRADGHDIHIAAQRLDGFAAGDMGTTLWQAPVWPRLLGSAARPATIAPRSMTDILARLGLDLPGAVEGLLAAWDSLIAAIRPEAIVADFAPALILAARGRVPVVQIACGFEAPPGNAPDFPSFTEGRPVPESGHLLRAVNAELQRTARPPIDRLPRLFDADRVVIAGFAELDPYAASRASHAAPILRSPPEATGGQGDEVFVYLSDFTAGSAELWQGLAQSGLMVRAHVNGPLPDMADALRGIGITVEAEPLPFAEICRRSRMVISHGGHGFVCSALLAGIPQIVTPTDTEKRLYADRVMRLGVGGKVPLADIRAEPFAESLRRIYEDGRYAQRAKALAPGFQKRMDHSASDEIASVIAGWTG